MVPVSGEWHPWILPCTGQDSPPPQPRAILPTILSVLRLRNPVIKNVKEKTLYKKKKKSEGQLADEQVLETQYSDCTVITDNTIELYTFDLLRD